MAALKNSKTENNLKAAFAGESQANRRYLYFAQKADVEGYNDVSAVFRSTILQVTVPDALRGRLSGIFMLVVTGGPKLGDLEAGVVAAAVSPAFSVITGGLACVVGAFATGALYPELRRYDTNVAGTGRVSSDG